MSCVTITACCAAQGSLDDCNRGAPYAGCALDALGNKEATLITKEELAVRLLTQTA